MIVEERMIGRGKDDVRLIIEKMSEREAVRRDWTDDRACREGALLIGTRHRRRKASDRHIGMMMNHDQSC